MPLDKANGSLIDRGSMSFRDEDGVFTWNGYPYFDRLRDALPDLPALPGVREAQHCWTAYVPDTDRFLVGYDLWLEETEPDDGPRMGAALAFAKFSVVDDNLKATIEQIEQSSESFYDGDLLDRIPERFPKHIVLDLD